MIDWWGVFYNSLWIVGLAGSLAALSLTSYQARVQQVRLRQKLNEPGFLLPFSLSMTLFCLGLLLGSGAWWEKVIWGLLALVFAGQALWLWRGQRIETKAAQAEPPLRESEATPTQKRSSKWLGRGLILAGLLVLVAWVVVTGVQVLSHARSLQAHLQQLEGLAQGDAQGLGFADLETAGQHLAGMHDDLAAIDRRVGSLLPLGRLLSWVPGYGGDLAAASDLLNLAVAVSAAGDRTFQALAPALDLVTGMDTGAGSLPGDSSPNIGERVLPVLVAAQPELQTARQELAAAQQVQTRLDTRSLSPRVAGLLERLNRYLPWFETALDGAMLAPDLLGGDGRRTYLILAQNNFEMRATGGFITGVGELTIEDGRLASLSFSDSYAIDNLEVPHEITPPDFQATLFGQLWFFRDTNWNADYPTSARRAMEVYANDRGVQSDGAIALDLTALQILVDAVAPLQVEGIDQPVTGKNVLKMIQEQWDESYVDKGKEYQEWWQHRKDFMGQIARTAMDKVMTGQDLQPLKLAQALKRAVDEKHLLIYLNNPMGASLLRERNWDGALAEPTLSSDTLLVADSNVGFDKMDASVERSIHYRVDLGAEGGPRAWLTLSYKNRATRPAEACRQESRYGDSYADMMQRCYYDYVRAYVPDDSQLLAGPDLPAPAGSLLARMVDVPPSPPISPTLIEGNRAVWTAFFVMETLGEQTLTFEYRLPARVLDQNPDGLVHYRLQAQKQPGTEAVPLHLEFVLPAGAELVRTVPADLPQAQGAGLQITSDLRTDRVFELVYREETGRP